MIKGSKPSLGIVAVWLPHVERDATIQMLLSLAPRRSRAALQQNLILSGESIDIEMVRDGIAEVFEAAKAQKWIVGGRLRVEGMAACGLRTVQPMRSPLCGVRGLPDDQRRPETVADRALQRSTAEVLPLSTSRTSCPARSAAGRR
jgi:hypothetical protein